MKKITAVIFAHNEENNTKECITSAKFLTQEIIVIEIDSQDKTAEVAKESGAKTVPLTKTDYVEPARGFGINQATTDWVLILDADERLTKELAEEVRNSLKDETITHYQISRKNIFGKVKWLKHGGWWPDYQTRLINKKYFKAWPKEIHSSPIITGPIARLNNPLLHYFHGDLDTMVTKTIIFENIESDLLFKANRKTSSLTFFRKFLGEFYRRMFKRVGFLDGEIGIIESIYQAFSKTITYLYLYEKQAKLAKKKKGRSI
jgi:glycosyltransferase involved in cell wall biosynthesis